MPKIVRAYPFSIIKVVKRNSIMTIINTISCRKVNSLTIIFKENSPSSLSSVSSVFYSVFDI
jgi:hypothetical protein